MEIKTELPFYTPGQTVKGQIYIETERAVKCEGLVLEIDAKEKSKFYRNWEETRPKSPPGGHSRPKNDFSLGKCL